MLGFHLLLVNSESWPLTLLGLYLITLSFFHYSEFLITAINHPKSVDIDAFLLNNKLEYHLNIAASLVEFGLESYYFSAWKFSCLYLVWTGLALIVFGETVRKLAMLTAGRSFTHIIRQKKGDLELVVTGVYSLCRHPSYVGWFYWVIGTQVRVTLSSNFLGLSKSFCFPVASGESNLPSGIHHSIVEIFQTTNLQ